MTDRGRASPSKKQPDEGEPSADPFARIANALHEEPAPAAKLKRPPHRSRPSFSDLAPVLPPTPTPPLVTHPPVVNRVEVVGSGPSEPPRINPLPFVPSVIVSEEPPSMRSRPRSDNGPTTLRVIRREASPPRTLSPSTVLMLLALSLTVFGVGIAALFYSRSPAPRVNAADLPPPALSTGPR